MANDTSPTHTPPAASSVSLSSAGSSVGPGDRLSFTLFLALAVHGLLIFGVVFSYSGEPAEPPSIEITLATHKTREAPDRADFKAQFNQQASGTLDEKRELTTQREADFADNKIREVTPIPQQQAMRASEEKQLETLHTDAESRLQVAKLDDPQELTAREEREGQDTPVPARSTEIASLMAKLDRQKQAYANRPRIQRLTSVSTMAAPEAAYLHRWQQRIETVGNDNFPQQALARNIFGQLRVSVTINTNGTIDDVELLGTSGHKILDSAALQIVHLAAPFEPFPGEISRDWDQLKIIRTWRFEITGLTTR